MSDERWAVSHEQWAMSSEPWATSLFRRDFLPRFSVEILSAATIYNFSFTIFSRILCWDFHLAECACPFSTEIIEIIEMSEWRAELAPALPSEWDCSAKPNNWNDERSKRRSHACMDYALQGGIRRQPNNCNEWVESAACSSSPGRMRLFGDIIYGEICHM